MKYPRWHKLLAAALAAGLAGSVAASDPATTSEGRMIVVREPGKPDKHCIVLKSTVQPDGSVLHQVRNLQTGETLLVANPRSASPTPYAPITPKSSRLPTTAELAGNPAGSLTKDSGVLQKIGFQRKSKPATPPAAPSQPPATAQPATSQPPAALQAQLANLKDAMAPSQRELAAMTLTLGDAHNSPEVVGALMAACRTDPASSVRATCIRCLFRLAPEAPQVIPVIAERQNDKNVEVQKLAKLAVEELNRQLPEKGRR